MGSYDLRISIAAQGCGVWVEGFEFRVKLLWFGA